MLDSKVEILLSLSFCAFWLQPISLFGCFIVTELKDTSLSLPIGVLLADDQFRLPVRAAFIPALEIDDHSLLQGKCFYPQHLGRGT